MIEWNKRHKFSMLFIVFLSTIALYEIVVDMCSLEDTTKKVLMYPRYLHRNEAISKKRGIFDEVNLFLKQLSRSQRFERNAVLHLQMNEIVDSMNELKPGHLPENNAGRKVTLIFNAVNEIDHISSLLSNLNHMPYWSKQTNILLGLTNVTYQRLSVNLKILSMKLPYFKWEVLPESETKLLVHVLVSLVQKVSTPYVFFVRNMKRFDKDFKLNQFLKPLVHQNIDVVSGAVMYPGGHWQSGCHQSKLIWSQYQTQHGYDLHLQDASRRSDAHKWISCDYFDGPFAMRKDLFLYILSNKIRKICPDHMFYRHLIYTLNNKHAVVKISLSSTFLMNFKQELSRPQWLDFGFLNEISESISIDEDDTKTKYEFNNTELKCVCSNKLNMLKPRACIRDLHFMLMNSYKLFDKYNYGYTNEDGSGMAATKLDDTLPWDLDQDFAFRSSDFSDLIKHEDEFQKVGMRLAKELDKPCLKKITSETDFSCAYIGLRGRNWRLEAWGEYLLSGDIYQPWKLNPVYRHLFPKHRIFGNDTKVRMRDHWSQNRANPGLYARSHYGCDVLRHAKHWYEGGSNTKVSSWGDYITRPRFGKCAIEGHQLCLTQYLADGNIQFQQPWA